MAPDASRRRRPPRGGRVVLRVRPYPLSGPRAGRSGCRTWGCTGSSPPASRASRAREGCTAAPTGPHRRARDRPPPRAGSRASGLGRLCARGTAHVRVDARAAELAEVGVAVGVPAEHRTAEVLGQEVPGSRRSRRPSTSDRPGHAPAGRTCARNRRACDGRPVPECPEQRCRVANHRQERETVHSGRASRACPTRARDAAPRRAGARRYGQYGTYPGKFGGRIWQVGPAAGRPRRPHHGAAIDREVDRPADTYVVEGRDTRVEEQGVDRADDARPRPAGVAGPQFAHPVRRDGVLRTGEVVGAAALDVRHRGVGLDLEAERDRVGKPSGWRGPRRLTEPGVAGQPGARAPAGSERSGTARWREAAGVRRRARARPRAGRR